MRKNVYQKWCEWATRNGVRGDRCAKLYARLVFSPAANRV